MYIYLGFLIFSFIVSCLAIIPFINALYKFKFSRRIQQTLDPQGELAKQFDKLHNWKAGTPVGGGLLIIIVVTALFSVLFPTLMRISPNTITSAHLSITWEISILFFTFISFGLLGLYDDFLKSFQISTRKFFGLRMRHKFIIQWILAFAISYALYNNLGIDIIPIIPPALVLNLGWVYIPIAAIIIVGFANAYNITDGLDGLSSGLLMICLFVFWAIASSALDTVLSMFIAFWLGSVIAFLYFNIYPARIWLGDVGALSFGATLAVVGLLLGKTVVLMIIGGIFIVEAASSAVQLVSKRYFGRRLLPVAPLHLTLQKMGWEEPKIVFRAWLAGIMLGIFGLWLATLHQ